MPPTTAACWRASSATTPAATAVDAWDSAYLQERVKAEQYNFDSQAVRPYFEYRRVKQGVMDITSGCSASRFRPVPDAAVWHPDVEAYDVLDGDRGCSAGSTSTCTRATTSTSTPPSSR